MGATRPASGIKEKTHTLKRLTDSTNYMPVCELFFNARRETHRPH